jgi:lipopolysaccharide biosynthesis glycosyltransferase
VDRVLYLDSDIVVIGSIAPLWSTDLNGALLGAVDIPGSDRGVSHLGLRAKDGYFNSGVLLIDLQQWRDTEALETVLQYVEANPERMMRDVDQEALNACFHSRKKVLDHQWNAMWPFFLRRPTGLDLTTPEIDRVRKEARIIHFNGSLKPWSYFCDHPRKTEYIKYLKMTEWRNFTELDRTASNIIRKRILSVLPHKVKGFLRNLYSRFHAAAGH